DTFETLDSAGIPYIGAGDSRERARKLQIEEIAGMKIGFLAASRVIPVTSWDVRNQTPGVFTTYDPTDLLADIKKAKKKCDYVFVIVHWGIEHTTELVDYERPMAHQFIDAGADAVIGAHPHVVQGIECYNGKMIYYSLGNFIFSQSIERTFAVSMKVEPDGITHKLIPAAASNAKTSLLTEEAAKNVYSYMDGLSDTVTVTDKGKVNAK
ncbi:MAG: CapA family protein, partial [Lachnospiraceae bacterium]|nr:CapA family protein [Lachnospiraceae bacterium]